MTETETEVVDYHTETPAADEPLFENRELQMFDADDAEAGTAIGKLLCFFFLYTVIAMTIVGWWTFSTVMGR